MQTLWKHRTELHPTFAPVNRSLREDWFLLPFELKLQRAHAVTLRKAGILADHEHAAIVQALDEVGRLYEEADCPDSEAEDLHTFLETELVRLAGDAGRKIHTARSRNDQVATLLKMYVIDAGRGLERQLREMIAVSCRRALAWSELVFPLQTHGQFAAPGSVGFWALRLAAALDRTRRHLEMLLELWTTSCPLGAGAVAGSSIPIDRGLQARELGFRQAGLNALDDTTARDECLDLLALLTRVALHLQTFATDVIAFSQTPFAWTVYPAEFGTGSSMMPNKTNPDAMELLRGECNAVAAAHAQAILLVKGLPSGYSRDLQCIKPVVQAAAERLSMLAGMTTAFLDRLDFDEAGLGRSCRLGAIDATLRMEGLVLEGTPLREAHHAVAALLEREPSNGAAAAGADAYRTSGSASPAETRRIAGVLLATVQP